MFNPSYSVTAEAGDRYLRWHLHFLSIFKESRCMFQFPCGYCENLNIADWVKVLWQSTSPELPTDLPQARWTRVDYNCVYININQIVRYFAALPPFFSSNNIFHPSMSLYKNSSLVFTHAVLFCIFHLYAIFLSWFFGGLFSFPQGFKSSVPNSDLFEWEADHSEGHRGASLKGCRYWLHRLQT